MTVKTKKEWNQLAYKLPPLEATDGENAYISKQVLIKNTHEDFIGEDLFIGVFFIAWDGGITLSAGNWFAQHVFRPDDECFDNFYWKEIE